MKKTLIRTLIIILILLVSVIIVLTYRWVMPRGKPFYMMPAYAIGATRTHFVSPKGTNEIIVFRFGDRLSIVHKHWLYGAREVVTGGLNGYDVPEVVWDNEASFSMDFVPDDGSQRIKTRVNLSN